MASPPARDSQGGGIFFRTAFFLCFLCMLFALYVVRLPLLRLVGGFWIVDESPAQADAIIMLGDDNFNADRAARAAQLYRAGWAPRVVASGRYLRPYASIAELEEHDLEDRGVPAADVVRFTHKAENTRDETAALAQLISSRGWKRVLLVTSTYHTRRSRYIAERQFPPGTALRVVAAPDSDYDPEDWWRTRNGLKIFTHECVGMLVSMWEMRHKDVQTSGLGLVYATADCWRFVDLGPQTTFTGRFPCTIVRKPRRMRDAQLCIHSTSLAGGFMWRKPNEVKPSEQPSAAPPPTRAKSEELPTLQTPQMAPSPSAPAMASVGVSASSNLSKISFGLKIRGELSGDSDLYIDGDVQGKVQLTNGRVTVGPNGRVQAEIEARQICVEGTVQGNLKATESAQLGASSRIVGNVVSPRIGVADGAQLSGKMETTQSAKSSALETPEAENHREAVGAKLEYTDK